MKLRYLLLPLLLLILAASCRFSSSTAGVENLISLPAESRGVSWGKPVWSPENRTIAFNAFDAGTGFVTIYTLDLASRSKNTFHEPSDYGILGWSDNHRMLLGSPGELSIADDTQGSPIKALTHGLYGVITSSGNKIAKFRGFSSRITPQMKYAIQVINLDSGRETPLYSFESSKINPIYGMAWSPDGETLAFSKKEENNHSNLYLMSISTNELRQLTKGHDDLAPTWSPDGSHIAFQRDSGLILQSSSIVISNLAGEECLSIPIEGLGSGVSWSPNGEYLAYSTGTGIFLVELASTRFASSCQ